MPLWIGVLAVIGWIAIQIYWESKKDDKEKVEFEEKVRDNEVVDLFIDELYKFKTHRLNSKMSFSNASGIDFIKVLDLLGDILNAQIAYPYYCIDEEKSIPYFVFIFQDCIVENLDLFENVDFHKYSKFPKKIGIESIGQYLIEQLEKEVGKKIFRKTHLGYYNRFSKLKEEFPDNYKLLLDGQMLDFIKTNLEWNEHLTSANSRRIISSPKLNGLVNETTWIWSEIFKGTTIQELRTYYTTFIENSDIIRFRGYPHG